MWREDFEDGIFEVEEQGNPRQIYVAFVLGVYWVIFQGVCCISVGILVLIIIIIIIIV